VDVETLRDLSVNLFEEVEEFGGPVPLVARKLALGAALATLCLGTAVAQDSLVSSAPVLCATDRLSWIRAASSSSPRRWRQRVSDERSNGSLWQNDSSPQKYW